MSEVLSTLNTCALIIHAGNAAQRQLDSFTITYNLGAVVAVRRRDGI